MNAQHATKNLTKTTKAVVGARVLTSTSFAVTAPIRLRHWLRRRRSRHGWTARRIPTPTVLATEESEKT
jgi:hypothetical protein